MDYLLSLLIGYSVVVAGVLFVAYALFLENLNKSARALVTCVLLLSGLAQLQLGHGAFFTAQFDPLQSLNYQIWLFLVPSMFYLFSRSILFEETRFAALDVLHLLPVLLPLVLRIEIAMAILFCIGTGYSLWLTHVVYSLQSSRARSKFELFFLVLFSALAVGVLLLGFALPYMDPGYFYTFYTLAIGVALMLVVGALLSFPELLADLAAAAKASYATSTLGEVDVEDKKRQLDKLMVEDHLYQQESLNLAGLAEALQLSSHQLSELINTEFGISFSRYIRQFRVQRAIRLLKDEPQASILSISMEVGFRSQSNFYAAFKEVTGQSPSQYRK